METNNPILDTFNQQISPLNAKLLRVKKRLDITKDNIINLLSGYNFLMSRVRPLRKLLKNGDNAIFDMFFAIREPCVKFKISAEQFKIDREEFLWKFYQEGPALLNKQHENIKKAEDLLAINSPDEASKFRISLDKFQQQLKLIEQDFMEFNKFYQAGTVEKSVEECEFTIQYLFTKAKEVH